MATNFKKSFANVLFAALVTTTSFASTSYGMDMNFSTKFEVTDDVKEEKAHQKTFKRFIENTVFSSPQYKQEDEQKSGLSSVYGSVTRNMAFEAFANSVADKKVEGDKDTEVIHYARMTIGDFILKAKINTGENGDELLKKTLGISAEHVNNELFFSYALVKVGEKYELHVVNPFGFISGIKEGSLYKNEEANNWLGNVFKMFGGKTIETEKTIGLHNVKEKNYWISPIALQMAKIIKNDIFGKIAEVADLRIVGQFGAGSIGATVAMLLKEDKKSPQHIEVLGLNTRQFADQTSAKYIQDVVGSENIINLEYSDDIYGLNAKLDNDFVNSYAKTNKYVNVGPSYKIAFKKVHNTQYHGADLMDGYQEIATNPLAFHGTERANGKVYDKYEYLNVVAEKIKGKTFGGYLYHFSAAEPLKKALNDIRDVVKGNFAFCPEDQEEDLSKTTFQQTYDYEKTKELLKKGEFQVNPVTYEIEKK